MYFLHLTEEINHSYDGGLNGELIQNGSFKQDSGSIAHWKTFGVELIDLQKDQVIDGTGLNYSLSMKFSPNSENKEPALANEGFWGIPVWGNTTYQLSFYAKAEKDFQGPLNVSIQSQDEHIYAKTSVSKLSSGWQLYKLKLKTGNVAATQSNWLKISSPDSGTISLTGVSLFVPTYHNRVNGNRPDIMKKLKALHPKFLRFPGGTYLRGSTARGRFDWKATIGDVTKRPGHPGPWKYYSSDRMGLLEFLLWCEDLQMEPVLGIYSGYSFDQKLLSDKEFEYYLRDGLDEIEYIKGSTDTKWGAVRAQNGHPQPFKLNYVEIGNEEGSENYNASFRKFYSAIKEKYPSVQIIYAGGRTNTVKTDIVDEHRYTSMLINGCTT